MSIARGYHALPAEVQLLKLGAAEAKRERRRARNIKNLARELMGAERAKRGFVAVPWLKRRPLDGVAQNKVVELEANHNVEIVFHGTTPNTWQWQHRRRRERTFYVADVRWISHNDPNDPFTLRGTAFFRTTP